MISDPVVEADSRDPGFYRGDGESSSWCDYLMPSGDACDEPPQYEIRWKPVPALDGDSQPVSVACLEHALPVDRGLVESMRSVQRKAVLSCPTIW